MPYNYVIVGPNDECDGLPTFWNNESWKWGAFENATRFNSNILRAYPLPVGGKYVLDVRTINTSWKTMVPFPVGGSEDNPVDILLSQAPRIQLLMNKLGAAIKNFRKSFDKFS